MTALPSSTRVAVIGGGFTGLSAAWELARAGVAVTVLEADAELGGLAGAFDVQGHKLDRFYHHWFTNDLEVMTLIDELGLHDRVSINPTNTGVWYGNHFFKLSTPMDLLRFTPLPMADRVRLGLLALRARKVENWMELEHKTASQWLKELGGEKVYRVVWEPLLKGKFGAVADQISAVWFWNKLKLRGGSRGKGGEERLAYFKGGFVALAEAMAEGIRAAGGQVLTSTAVHRFTPQTGGCFRLETSAGELVAEQLIATPALPLIADMAEDWAPAPWLAQMRRINYLSNVCLVLELERSLSTTYWLNVNDPTFPFVAVIEHTNFERPSDYGGRHIVYLSRYLPHTDAMYSMSADEMLAFATPWLKKMFPAFDPAWVLKHHVWRARYSQPVVEQHYSNLIPASEGPAPGLTIASMAQIYPEDRGTNYAVREGRKAGRAVAQKL
ncbi:NAD(P)/FAD-dependent oxidoreductase [Amantichitinum ursilacus]|uniref:15-cis-phytoene desaturase n=1 Tax=Amantichitinum ursilacus TaxID=857265 RepID=A0A0N0XFT0_9NEIS|nr:NAD(P)/FAD-dependent oxidoreductase [Amantichitinum ursilacus]KPC49380.1 15-cis-phytoene desaturase [Amantichitinum ursilacus]